MPARSVIGQHCKIYEERARMKELTEAAKFGSVQIRKPELITTERSFKFCSLPTSHYKITSFRSELLTGCNFL